MYSVIKVMNYNTPHNKAASSEITISVACDVSDDTRQKSTRRTDATRDTPSEQITTIATPVTVTKSLNLISSNLQ